MEHFSPLRYPGGKGKFAPFIKKLIHENNITGDYFEPFAGGAGIGLDLLFNGYCKKIHINDLDSAIYNFWHSITANTDEFLRLTYDTQVTIEEWHRQKEILNTPENYSPLEHGFSAFFLNRTNRSGILKAGVIGGLQQAGAYKLDARFSKNKLLQRIKRIGEFSNRIKVYNLDAIQLLQSVDDLLPSNSLIYLDPPYYVKGQGLYRNFYLHQDHVDIHDALNKVETKWIVSYDNCNEIKQIYNKFRKSEYQLNYSAYSKTKGSEVMFYSDNIQLISKP